MRKGLMFILFLGWLFGPPSKVQEATNQFALGKYKEAAIAWEAEIPNYENQRIALEFNVAQAWLRADSANRANTHYGTVTNLAKQDPQLACWAWNNVGCMQVTTAEHLQKSQQQSMMQQGQQPSAGDAKQDPQMLLMAALQSFKDALKQDHNSATARFNYELLKHKLNQQQQQQQNQENKDQEQQQDQQQNQEQNKNDKSQDQQNDSPDNQENKGQPSQQGQGQGDAQQMSGEEAQRILEAMNSNEKKYLQQLEKGKKVKVYSEKDGHDW